MPKRRTSSAPPGLSVTHGAVIAMFLFTVAAFALGILLPTVRAWGINIWAFLPPTGQIVTALASVLIGALAAFYFFRQLRHDQAAELAPMRKRDVSFGVLTAGTVVFMSLLFYLLRAETHFQGDGYALLSNLAKDQPFVKPTEFGSELVTHWVRSLIGVPAETAYQAVSIASGTLFVIAASWFAARCVSGWKERLLLLLGLCSGGYMLLFFGYVENYSLLCAAVVVFVAVGTLVARGSWLPKYIILVPLGIAVYFHVVGSTLLPAAVYLLAESTTLSQWPKGWSFGLKLTTWSIVALVLVVTITQMQGAPLFIRLAFVPLIEQRFTAAGYTLFSGAHILDIANLLVLLVPSILIFAVASFDRSVRARAKSVDVRFLIVSAASTSGAVFLLDPKLGMFRDWDLFAFAGVPLVALGFVTVLTSGLNPRLRYMLSILAIGLGIVSLAPRVVVQHNPSLGVRLAEGTMPVDLMRNRTGYFVLQTYYETVRDSANAKRIQAVRDTAYLEAAACYKAKRLIADNQISEAMPILQWAAMHDPSYPEAWAGLCICYYRMAKYDSALYAAQVADGLNPNSAAVMYNMGLAYYGLGEKDRAERCWLKSLKITPDLAVRSLIYLYKERGDTANYAEYLWIAAARPNATGADMKELITLQIEQRRFPEASEMIARLLALGDRADSVWVDQLIVRNPILRPGH